VKVPTQYQNGWRGGCADVKASVVDSETT